MKLDEQEENNRKRLAKATLQAFELLDAGSRGRQLETTSGARGSARSGKAVQDWVNTSLALSFNNEKMDEPKVVNEPPECLVRNNDKIVGNLIIEFSRHSIPQFCRGNYILSTETFSNSIRITPPTNDCLAVLTHMQCTRRFYRLSLTKPANTAQCSQTMITKEPHRVTRLLYRHPGFPRLQWNRPFHTTQPHHNITLSISLNKHT